MYMYVCGHLIHLSSSTEGLTSLHIDGRFCGLFQTEQAAMGAVLSMLPIPEVA